MSVLPGKVSWFQLSASVQFTVPAPPSQQTPAQNGTLAMCWRIGAPEAPMAQTEVKSQPAKLA